MDDFVGVANVIPPKRLKELSVRSDAKGLFQAATHIGAIALTTVLLAALSLVAMPGAASAADRAGSHDHLIVRVWHAPTTPTAILGY